MVVHLYPTVYYQFQCSFHIQTFSSFSRRNGYHCSDAMSIWSCGQPILYCVASSSCALTPKADIWSVFKIWFFFGWYVVQSITWCLFLMSDWTASEETERNQESKRMKNKKGNERKNEKSINKFYISMLENDKACYCCCTGFLLQYEKYVYLIWNMIAVVLQIY